MDTNSSYLSIKNVCKSFIQSNDKDHLIEPVIKDLSLEIAKGEIVALFGPNGCGKSTLLNIISGLDNPDSGEITFNPNYEKKIGYAFQQYENSLYPWRTIIDNITLKLEIEGMPAEKRRQKGIAFAEQFGIFLDWNSYPYQLSGGQKQMVALLRSFIYRPDFCVLDEPLSALDYQNALDMMVRISKDWTSNNITAFVVSHDIEQAIFLADRVIILTKRPMSSKTIIDVPFSHPRSIDILEQSKFFELRTKALKAFVEVISN